VQGDECRFFNEKPLFFDVERMGLGLWFVGAWDKVFLSRLRSYFSAGIEGIGILFTIFPKREVKRTEKKRAEKQFYHLPPSSKIAPE